MPYRLALRNFLLGAIVVLGLAACIGVVGVLRLTAALRAQIERETVAILDDEATANRFVHHVYKQQAAALRYAALPDPAWADVFREQGDSAYRELRRYLFRDLELDERRHVERLRETFEMIEVESQRVFARPEPSHTAVPNMERLVADLDRFVDLRRDRNARLMADAAGVWRWLYLAFAALGLIFVVGLFTLGRFLRTRLLIPLSSLSAAANRLGAGDFEVRVPVDRNDELAAVGHSFNTMAERLRVAHRLEEQLRQAQKMEAVGQLAGGVAHDFNNVLTAIRGYTELLGDADRDEEVARADLREIRGAVERASSLTRQLLAFSRHQVVQPRQVEVTAILNDVERMLLRLIGADVKLVIQTAPPLWVHMDPGQLQQVFVNLIVNARDAMPGGGTIRVSIAPTEIDAAAAPTHLESGPYVAITVSDMGSGIDPDVIPHIFEPFFTTKSIGKGTGLGLSTVYGIVQQAGGAIVVDSMPGSGTTFTVLLPRIEAPAVAPGVAAPAVERVATGSEVVMVVEDEAALRALALRVLKREGYTVLAAENGADALAILGNQPRLDLLVTDVIMPNMGGAELAARLTAERPDLHVLYMSGYAPDDLPLNFDDPRFHFLEKPFSPADLIQKVRSVLGEEVTRT